MPDPFTNALGMDSQQIATLVRQKLHELLEVKPATASWDDLPQQTRQRWMNAIDDLFIKCERQVQMSAQLATRRFVDEVLGHGTYDKLTPHLKIFWEALMRHTINLITAGQAQPGEANSPAELRQELDEALKTDWQPWIRERVEKLTYKEKT